MRLFSCEELRKALDQALKKRKYFTIFYIVLAQYRDTTREIQDDTTLSHFISCVIDHDDILKKLRECHYFGIGIIVRYQGSYLVVLKSSHLKKGALDLYLKLTHQEEQKLNSVD